MIEFKEIHKSFEKRSRFSFGRTPQRTTVRAVQGISMVARDGAITGLLGANGAGKTTSLRMLGGLFSPDRGAITVDGLDVATNRRATLQRLGILADACGLYPRLTARENIVYYAELRGLTKDQANERIETLARVLEMRPLLDRKTGGFSQGERMKTALVRCLVHDPANIVLDEPTNGLDVTATRGLREALLWFRSPAGGGKCILLSTHIMQEVEQLCDEVFVVAEGRTVANGTVDRLQAVTGTTRFEEAFVRLAFAHSELQ